MSAIPRAWLALVVASAATTLFAFLGTGGTWAAAALLALALIKSRVILSDYLGLSRAPGIRAGFMAVLTLWAGVCLALSFAAQS